MDLAWQPIETAPKDGTRVLAFVPGENGGPRILNWCSDAEWLHGWEDERGVILKDHPSSSGAPTHWMPLPPPPSSNASA